MTNKFILLMLSMVLFLGACRTSKSGRTQSKMVVKADTVKDHQGELSIVYPGKIKAASDVNLAFRVAGPILRMPLEVGAFVKKGTLIAEIDPRDYEIQFSATEAEFRQVKGEAERVIELYRRKSVPVNDYEKAVYGLRQITAKYNAHKNALEDTRLLAPFDGYIQKKIFNPHETVNAGIPVISMINNTYFDVEIDIPSSDYVRQNLFKSFSCTIDVFPNKVFPLELIEVTRKANLNQLYKMRLRLKPEKGFDIAAGMSVNVNIEYNPQISELTIIPLSAIFENKGDSAVWVYNPSTQTVSMRGVKLSKLLKDGTAIVAQGLKVGEIVISAGVHELKEGMKVELLKGVSSTNVGGLL
ncbi:efflux RND transporter periplasmic adaptor subunit [uncultured Sanguibacteroides sp.]|uniref:efflux RND transporter periplasmic adaptor subunit n=1 Tax=uncultured Sanguibacteroides sp. TaxID=1635151 RepID=UPI0025F4756E|nr:efflux RND transporter periplasmic adaptor subunit [uncultured Sanguibacteroides sp.]